MRLPKKFFCIVMLLGAVPSQASLLEAWDAALVYDPVFQVASANRDVGIEESILGRAQLLPQVSVSGSLGKAKTESERQSVLGPVPTTEKYDTESWALQLRQALYKPRAYAGYQQGKAVAASAEFSFAAARQGLALRLVDASAKLVQAKASLKAAELAVATNRQVATLTARQLQAGELTRADQSRAKARLQRAQRDVLATRAELIEADMVWRNITGQSRAPDLQLLDQAVMQLTLPFGGSIEALVQVASVKNPALAAARKEIEAAQFEVKKAKAERMPSVDLVASRSFNDSESDNIIGSSFDTSRVAVTASMPLFTGGAISAVIRQSLAKQLRAEAELRDIMGKARLSLSKELVVFEEAKQAAAAAEADFEAAQDQFRQAELGRIAGTATLAEYVDAELALVLAKRDLQTANAKALTTWARVHDVLGSFGENELAIIDTTLSFN